MNHSYKAVLFDLDGTLLDTLADLAGSMNFVLDSHGFAEHAVENYKLFVGDGVENLVIRSLPADVDGTVIPELVLEMKEYYSKHWHSKTRPYGDIPEMLKTLQDKGIALSVLSNKPDEFTKLMVNHYFKDIRFAAVFGARKDVPIKPDPAGALEVCNIAGFKPEEFVYLGDSGTDMETAVNAGMFPVGALWGFRDEKELMESGAKMVVSDPKEVLELF